MSRLITPPNVAHSICRDLAVTGGQERTEDEYRAFWQGRLRLTRVIPTHGPVSIVEAE